MTFARRRRDRSRRTGSRHARRRNRRTRRETAGPRRRPRRARPTGCCCATFCRVSAMALSARSTPNVRARRRVQTGPPQLPPRSRRLIRSVQPCRRSPPAAAGGAASRSGSVEIGKEPGASRRHRVVISRSWMWVFQYSRTRAPDDSSHWATTIGDSDRMPSALETLTSARYDLLVIGGGIHGLFAAYDAAQRGLSVGARRARRFRQRADLQPPAHHPRRASRAWQRARSARRARQIANGAPGPGSRRTCCARCPSSSGTYRLAHAVALGGARRVPRLRRRRARPQPRRLARTAPAERAARIGGRDPSSVSRGRRAGPLGRRHLVRLPDAASRTG